MIPLEKILFLNKVPLFSSLRAEDLYVISKIAREEEYLAKRVLFQEGDYGDKLFVIISGSVDLFRGIGEEKKKILTLRAKDFFGEMAVFDGELRSATVACQENCRFLVLEKEEVTELIYRYPDISFGIIKALCSRLRESNKKI